MKKRYVLLLLLVLGVLLLVGYQRYFYRFPELNIKNATLFEGPVKSPDSQSNARAYFINYGGAAGGVLYLVEVEHIQTGKKKVVYSSNHKDSFAIAWKDSSILNIKNESTKYNEYRNIELNVHKDIYEESGRACRSLRLKGKYEACYQGDGA